MSWPRSLNTLVSQLRYRADLEGLELRHPDANLRVLIQDSWQRLRQKLCLAGFHELYMTSVSGTMTAGAVAGRAYGTIPVPAGAVSIYGVDVTVQGVVTPLDPCSLEERNDFQSSSTPTGIPQKFHLMDVVNTVTGGELPPAGTLASAGLVMILPAPDIAYPYALYYIPAFTPVADADVASAVFDGVAGWDEWVLLDASLKAYQRDNDSQRAAALCTAERDRVWADILIEAARLQRAGAPQRRDTRKARESRSRLREFWP
jgi:hypothetical protein